MPEEKQPPEPGKIVCYSRDDEDYSCIELGDLLADLVADDELFEGATYYESDAIPLEWSGAFNVSNILESADERVYDDVGETYNNDFSNVSPEAKEELKALLNTWAGRHMGTSRYWQLTGKVRECKVTAEQVAEYQDEPEALP